MTFPTLSDVTLASSITKAALFRAAADTEAAILFGQYELLERINVGGMAEIMRARALSMPGQPIVAVKRILPHLVEDEQFVTMLLDESRVLSRLRHEHIVRTHDVGVVEGVPFLALEYVHGKDARNVFNECRRQGIPLPMPLACFIITASLEGLHYAHEYRDENGAALGLVHRDVSLQNILLSYDGEVKITDFGIARSADNKARTEAGVVKGKFGYMSPEQIRSHPLDRRSDVFAAGICLYELITGERLFSGENNYEAIDRVRHVKIDPPSAINRKVPIPLEAIVMKALGKDPEDRYQTAAEMSQALRSFMTSNQQRATATDLSSYLRKLFLGEVAAHDDMAVTTAAGHDAETGLAAFDGLDPVSQLADIAAPEQRIGATSLPPPPDPDDLEATSAVTDVNIPPLRVPKSEPLSSMDRLEPETDAQQTTLQAYSQDAESPAPQRVELTSERPPPPRLSAPPPAFPSDRPPANLEAPFVNALDTTATDEDGEQDEDEDDGDVTQVASRPSFRPEAAADNSSVEQATGLELPGYSQPPPPQSANAQSSGGATGEQVRPSSWPTRVDQPRTVPWTQRSLQDIPAPIALGGLGLILAVLLLLLFERRLNREDLTPGTIQFATQPEEVSVVLDGAPTGNGTSPIVLTGLQPNAAHEIRVEKPGYSDWHVRITVEPGANLKFPLVRLLPLEKPSTASGAPSLAATAVPPVEPPTAEKPGTARQNSPQVSRAKKAATRTARHGDSAATVGGQGFLRVNSRPWSQISVDGKIMGNTPQMNLPLPAGTHKVRLHNPQLNLTKNFRITIKPGQTATKIIFFD